MEDKSRFKSFLLSLHVGHFPFCYRAWRINCPSKICITRSM